MNTCYPGLLEKKTATHPHYLSASVPHNSNLQVPKSLLSFQHGFTCSMDQEGRILCLPLSHLFLWEAIGTERRGKLMPLCKTGYSSSWKAQTWSATGQKKCTWVVVFGETCILEANSDSHCSWVSSLNCDEDSAGQIRVMCLTGVCM